MVSTPKMPAKPGKLPGHRTSNQCLIACRVEADLDTEYTIGVATGVPVTFLSVGGDFTTALLDTTTFLDGVANPPSVMTTSYGTTESSLSPALAT